MSKKKKQTTKRKPITIDLAATDGRCSVGPRNVRNYWIEADVDGYTNPTSAGPKSKTGGFSMQIFQQHNGVMKRALTLRGTATDEGSISLCGLDGNGDVIFRIGSQR